MKPVVALCPTIIDITGRLMRGRSVGMIRGRPFGGQHRRVLPASHLAAFE